MRVFFGVMLMQSWNPGQAEGGGSNIFAESKVKSQMSTLISFNRV